MFESAQRFDIGRRDHLFPVGPLRYQLGQQESGGRFRIRCRVKYRHRYFSILVPDGYRVGGGTPSARVNDTA